MFLVSFCRIMFNKGILRRFYHINESVKEKIIYSSYDKPLNFYQQKVVNKLLTMERIRQMRSKRFLPIVLDKPQSPMEINDYNDNVNITMPFREIKVEFDKTKEFYEEVPEVEYDYDLDINRKKQTANWMNDYEQYCKEDDNDNDISWKINYGTPDKSIESSNIPCGGCGASLHCRNESVPGYIPSEIFKKYKANELRSITCQRCHFLQNYGIALKISVDPEEYPQIISKIKQKKAMVILMVDLTDFPCSIWPNILDVIGRKRPIFLVGNKYDLLPVNYEKSEQHIKMVLRNSFPEWANIIETSIISAKSGYGVEKLITNLQTIWKTKGDVYLIGCTNVGKSTLFNALIQSDYCKVQAVDLIQRATISPWPGTTLNLLKFPILRPEGWRIYLRNLRVKESKVMATSQLIGRTFHRDRSHEDFNFDLPTSKEVEKSKLHSGLNPNDPAFKLSKWFYDTPGVLHNDQILDLLTTDEIVTVLPQKKIEPRNYNFFSGWTLFIGGLARVDYIEGDKPVKLTVFASDSLPVTICKIEDAEFIYKSLLGSPYFAVPHNNKIRLKNWPNLEKNDDVISINGEYRYNYESCSDFVLSSVGWISISVFPKSSVKFALWTPEKRGIYVRTPSLLPQAVRMRGPLIRKTPAYEPYTKKYLTI